MIIQGRVLNADGGIIAPSIKPLEDLKKQLASAVEERAYWDKMVSEFQKGYDDCPLRKKVVGGCDHHINKKRDAERKRASLDITINDLQNNKIPKAQEEYDKALSNYQAALKAQTDAKVASDPTLANIKAQTDAKAQELMLQAKALANKNTLIWGSVIMVAILGVALTIYFIKKRKG